MAQAIAITGTVWEESSFTLLAYVEYEDRPALQADIQSVHIQFFNGNDLLLEDELVTDLQIYDDLITDDPRWCTEEYEGYNFIYQIPATVFTEATACGRIIFTFNPGEYQFKLVVRLRIKETACGIE